MTRKPQTHRRLLPAIAGLLLLAGFSAPSARAIPFAAIGDNARVYLIGGASVRYDDNIYLSRFNKQSDIITTASAGLQLEFGSPDTPNRGGIMLRKDHIFYYNRPENNSDNLSFSADGQYVGAHGSINVAAAVSPMEYNTRDAIGFGRLVQGTSYSASISGVYQFTGKTGLSGGITYTATEYSTEGYSNQQTVTVPVNVVYEVTAKTGVNAGYTYRATFITGYEGQNSVDHTFSIGTTREITKTLSGNLEIGVTHRTLGNGQSGTIIPVNGTLNWVATPRVFVSANVYRDFGNSALAGNSYLQTLVGVTLGYNIAERWNAGAGLSYEIDEYYDSTRVDHFWRGNVDLSYSPNQFISMSAGYLLQFNQSTEEIASFDDNQLTFSLNARY